MVDLKNMSKEERVARRARAYDNRAESARVARRSVIIGELAKLSRNGWAIARPCDYEPLEAELRSLER